MAEVYIRLIRLIRLIRPLCCIFKVWITTTFCQRALSQTGPICGVRCGNPTGPSLARLRDTDGPGARASMCLVCRVESSASASASACASSKRLSMRLSSIRGQVYTFALRQQDKTSRGGSFAELGLHRPKGLHTLPTAQGEKSRFSNTSVDILSIYKSDNISRSRKPRSLKTCSIEKNCIDKIVDVQYRKWFSINRSSKLLDTIFGISRSHFSNCCRH